MTWYIHLYIYIIYIYILILIWGLNQHQKKPNTETHHVAPLGQRCGAVACMACWGWFIPRTFPVKCGDGSWLNHEIQVCGWSYINSRLPLSDYYHILIQNHWFIPLSTHQAVTRLSKTCSSFVRAQRRKREGRWLKVIMRGNPLIFVCNIVYT